MPKKDFIWRGEEIIVAKSSFVNTLVDGLSEVFKNGFNQTDLDEKILSGVFEPLPPTYICASSTKCSDGEFIGRDNELVSAGTYGYIYLVEAKNITTIDVPKEKGSYAIVSKIDPSLIVGAIPSAFVAFALGVSDQHIIMNPWYPEKELSDDLKKRLGIESCITSDKFSAKYSKYTLENIYNRYLHTDVVTEFFKQNHASRLSQASPPALHP